MGLSTSWHASSFLMCFSIPRFPQRTHRESRVFSEAAAGGAGGKIRPADRAVAHDRGEADLSALGGTDLGSLLVCRSPCCSLL